ncbi:hypothetical protein DICA4_D06194 [Diutina catenulata]
MTMLIDNYIDLFENANKRHQSLEVLEKDVKKQLRKVEAERIKLKQVLAEIRRTKDANKVEERQLVAINESLKQIEVTSKDLERLALDEPTPGPRTQPSANRELFALIDKVRAPHASEIAARSTPRAKNADTTQFYDADSTFVDGASELEQYYPYLHTTKPADLHEQPDFKMPHPTVVIASSVDPQLPLKFASVQMAYMANGVPFDKWGLMLNRFLRDEALDAYLDFYHTRRTMSWSDALFLFFGDKDLYVVNAAAVDRWTRMRPHDGQSRKQFVAEFKQAVAASAPFAGRLEVEKAVLVSALALPYEVVEAIKPVTDRHEVYRIVSRRLV